MVGQLVAQSVDVVFEPADLLVEGHPLVEAFVEGTDQLALACFADAMASCLFDEVLGGQLLVLDELHQQSVDEGANGLDEIVGQCGLLMGICVQQPDGWIESLGKDATFYYWIGHAVG